MSISIPFIYKYQPRRLEDCVMEKNMYILYKTLLTNNNLLNILFIGNSGCGKTTFINVFIREYYGVYDIDNIENDSNINDNIMSINCLKEQGIMYYRNELRTFCKTKCSIIGKKKIIVMDDIDNINEQRQHVFRNFMDEFSHNVIFITSCNNINNVVETIQSRLLLINLKSVSNDNMKVILNKICNNENIKMTQKSKDLIISISYDSIRLLINYLEKCNLLKLENDDEITEEIIHYICTNISYDEFKEYTEICKYKKNSKDAINIIYKLYENGFSVMDILDNYFIYVKMCDFLNEEEKYKIIKLICKYITIFHIIHENEIELALFTNNMVSIFE